MKVLVIHGPNLNLLGIREPAVYGDASLAEVNDLIREKAEHLGVEVKVVQHNSEGDIIHEIHSAIGWADGIIINPAAYTHYSIAIRDALAAAGLPVIEVHLTNIFARETFRASSITGGAAFGVLCGLGAMGYVYALDYLATKGPGIQSRTPGS